MGKIAALFVVLFVVALVRPELRPVLVVGSLSWVTGFMLGSQRKAKPDAELVQARLVRGARTVEA